LAHHTVEFIK